MNLAVVTGASSGLGSALVEGLLENSWQVIGISRRGYSPATNRGKNYLDIKCDLAELAALPDLMENRVLSEISFDQLNKFCLINNAGVLLPIGGVSVQAPEALASAYRINSMAPTWLMDYLARNVTDVALSVTNVSSGAAVKSYPGWGAYCASKAALRMAGQVCFDELKQNVIKRHAPMQIISYAPGVVDTPMQQQVRSCSVEDFPGVKRFVSLYESGELVAAKDAALFLIKLLEPTFTEHDYQEVRYEK